MQSPEVSWWFAVVYVFYPEELWCSTPVVVPSRNPPAFLFHWWCLTPFSRAQYLYLITICNVFSQNKSVFSGLWKPKKCYVKTCLHHWESPCLWRPTTWPMALTLSRVHWAWQDHHCPPASAVPVALTIETPHSCPVSQWSQMSWDCRDAGHGQSSSRWWPYITWAGGGPGSTTFPQSFGGVAENSS